MNLEDERSVFLEQPPTMPRITREQIAAAKEDSKTMVGSLLRATTRSASPLGLCILRHG